MGILIPSIVPHFLSPLVGMHYVTAYGRAEIAGLERYPELWDTILEKYIPADQRQQFAAATQGISRASRVVIVLKPEKVVGRAWTPL